MDYPLNDFSYPTNEYDFSDFLNGETVHPGPDSNQDLNSTNGLMSKDDSFSFDFLDLPSPLLPEADPANTGLASGEPQEAEARGDLSDDGDYSDTVFKFIREMLMEEDIGNKPSMFHDPLALQAAEKSLYEVIGEDYNPFRDQHHPDILANISTDNSNSSSCSAGNSVAPGDCCDQLERRPLSSQTDVNSANHVSHSASEMPNPNNWSHSFNGLVDSSLSTRMFSDILSESDSVSLFRKGAEEASKFLPQEIILTCNSGSHLLNNSRGRKSHQRDDLDIEEERSAKQSAVSVDVDELSEHFDRVLLYPYDKNKDLDCSAVETLDGADGSLDLGEPGRFEVGKGQPRKRGKKKEVVDLRTQLILCAQAANANDRKTADGLLKQIRQHSSPFGDGTQRVAHYFANALEARLAGTGTQIYTSLHSKMASAADMLKAYQLYLSACPFQKVANSFANFHIDNLGVKGTVIHIIDFGIQYGFQWPSFFQILAQNPGKVSKLRITGIELPQPGFRPAEKVEETGRRLTTYSERFKIPFEYNPVAKKWETIRLEDLKINRDEAIAVNCLFRLENLLDDTVMVNSPRDAVLRLVRKINPDIFTHSVTNGSYNSPYFITRFREAIFHYSAVFDMFEANLPRENQERLMFEKGFYGREIMNVVACEGSERVLRPEMYKQWQVRIARAGFKQLPLGEELMNKLKDKIKIGYHKDFAVDKDGNWMLQGWKGRLINASSCWVPAERSV